MGCDFLSRRFAVLVDHSSAHRALEKGWNESILGGSVCLVPDRRSSRAGFATPYFRHSMDAAFCYRGYRFTGIGVVSFCLAIFFLRRAAEKISIRTMVGLPNFGPQQPTSRLFWTPAFIQKLVIPYTSRTGCWSFPPRRSRISKQIGSCLASTAWYCLCSSDSKSGNYWSVMDPTMEPTCAACRVSSLNCDRIVGSWFLHY